MTSVFPTFFDNFANWVFFSMRNFKGEVAEDQEHADPSSPDMDHMLMARVRNGDDTAFTKLFEKWKRPLISFFYRSLGDYHLSEDLALEVAVKVYKARDRYEPRARFSTWLFQIARNCLLDQSRKKRPEFRSSSDFFQVEWTYPETGNPGSDTQVNHWEDWLTEALKALPENEKSALLLVAQQGLKPSEAAEAMQIKPNHLRVLLNKARNRLRSLREEIL